MIRSLSTKWALLKTMKAIYQSVPSTTIASLKNLSEGDHIKLNKTAKYTDDAIVTDIDSAAKRFTVIRCKCEDPNMNERKAKIQEETIYFNEDQDVFLVNYKDRNMQNVMPQFKRIHKKDSIKVARYFMNNHVCFEPELMKDCEHFVLCCTMGFPINSNEMNRLLVGFAALWLFDKSAFFKMTEFMNSKRFVGYNEKDELSVKVQSNEYVAI